MEYRSVRPSTVVPTDTSSKDVLTDVSMAAVTDVSMASSTDVSMVYSMTL